jgi:hypothetical protein
LIPKALGLKQKRMPNLGSFRSTAQEEFHGPKPREEDGAVLPYPRNTVVHFLPQNEPPAEAAQ